MRDVILTCVVAGPVIIPRANGESRIQYQSRTPNLRYTDICIFPIDKTHYFSYNCFSNKSNLCTVLLNWEIHLLLYGNLSLHQLKKRPKKKITCSPVTDHATPPSLPNQIQVPYLKEKLSLLALPLLTGQTAG